MDFYLILGVRRAAPVSDIKRAYRRLARRFHPDINPGDPAAHQRFSGISEAYDVLSDPEKRRFYDSHGYYAEGVLDSRTDPRWDFSFRGFDSTASSDSSEFSDLFDDFFSHAQSARSLGEAETTNDLECQVSLTFEESIHGAEKMLNVYRQRYCEACRGSGRAPGSREYDCSACEGSGEWIRAKGHLRFSIKCSQCEGSGRVAVACSACGGEGRTVRLERIPVTLPPGVSAGSRVRFPGQGNVDRRTNELGDLYVVTNVASDPFFKRAGDNVLCTVPVTVTEAALGAKIQVPTVDGSALLKIPPGTQSGQVLRLRGKGAPSLRGDGIRGDQCVEVRVVVPRVVDERVKEILRELAHLNPDNPRGDLLPH